jgi:hypothetical protein
LLLRPPALHSPHRWSHSLMPSSADELEKSRKVPQESAENMCVK